MVDVRLNGGGPVGRMHAAPRVAMRDALDATVPSTLAS